jgi:hypothetical protein
LSPLSQDSLFRSEIESELRYHPLIGNQIVFPARVRHVLARSVESPLPVRRRQVSRRARSTQIAAGLGCLTLDLRRAQSELNGMADLEAA